MNSIKVDTYIHHSDTQPTHYLNFVNKCHQFLQAMKLYTRKMQ